MTDSGIPSQKEKEERRIVTMENLQVSISGHAIDVKLSEERTVLVKGGYLVHISAFPFQPRPRHDLEVVFSKRLRNWFKLLQKIA